MENQGAAAGWQCLEEVENVQLGFRPMITKNKFVSTRGYKTLLMEATYFLNKAK